MKKLARLLSVAVLAAPALAGEHDASNGVYGGYVGSSHWVHSMIRTGFVQGAYNQARAGSWGGGAGSGGAGSGGSSGGGYFMMGSGVGGYSRGMKTGPGYAAPASDGAWRAPKSDGGWKPPVSDGSWKPPQSDGGWKAPKSDGAWKAPRSDGRFALPPLGPGEEFLKSGDEALSRGDADGAIRAYRAVLRSNGQGKAAAKALFSLGAALLTRGIPIEAVSELGRAVAAEPGNDSYRLLYATALLDKGDLSAAETQAERTSAKATDGRSLLILALSLDRQGKRAEAIRAYERYLVSDDDAEIKARVNLLKSGR